MNIATPLAGTRILIAVTAPSSATFYSGQMAALVSAGADVVFVSSPSDEVAAQCLREGARYEPVPMDRTLAVWRDTMALRRLSSTIARTRPDIVNAGTPKAGLLGMLAARVCRIRRRVHTIHGLRYETAQGLDRRLLWSAQRVSCATATHVVCLSRSLRERAEATGLLPPGRGIVIGDGSVNGVDISRFSPNPTTATAGRLVRQRFGIGPDEFVVGYLGRLARDKGIAELASAWATVAGPRRHLLLGGDEDPTDLPPAEDTASLRQSRGVAFAGNVTDAPGFLAALDLLVLPSYREGFPTSPLEAAAMSLPVVSTRVTGCVDAVLDGVTGTLVPPRDSIALGRAIEQYATDLARRRAHGNAGRERAVSQFTSSRMHALMVDFYRRILNLE